MMGKLTRALGAVMVAATFAACDNAEPTEPQTVRLALIDGAQSGGAPFDTDFSQELTNIVTGDPDGFGHAYITINVGQQEVCWQNVASNILLPALASHIHNAAAGITGPIVIVLSPPNADGEAQGCRSGVDRDLLRDILTHPENYYVNVHTAEFPAGAVRGQLDQ